MNILELAILKKMVGGGGGSGTDNYNDLSNLPQINGETLAGNKTAENLGLQDALTFDSAPTKDSTNPVESNGVYNALAGKQDNLTFDGVYSASTNKVATESTVTNAIKDIAIASNQVTSMTGYTKPSSAPATPAIQTSDTANQAFGKLEFKADTNQTNILYTLGKTGKNIFNFKPNGNTSGFLNDDDKIIIMPRTYVFSFKATSPAASSSYSLTFRDASDSIVKTVSGGMATAVSKEFTISESEYNQIKTVRFYINSAAASITEVMICSSDDWNKSSDYQPYGGIQNSDLTRLEAEDRAGLVECVDGGAKNLWNVTLVRYKADNNDGTWNGNVYTNGFITYTVNSDLTVTAHRNGSTQTGTPRFYFSKMINKSSFSGCVLATCPKGGSSTTYFVKAEDYNSGYANLGEDYGDGVILKQATGNPYTIYASVSAKYTGGDITFKPMICTKAAFGVSNKFVPYRPNYDLVYDAIRKVDLTLVLTEYTMNSCSFTNTTAYKCNGLVVVSTRFSVDTALGISQGRQILTVYGAVAPTGSHMIIAMYDGKPLMCWILGQTIFLRNDTELPSGAVVYITGTYPCT